MTSEARMLVGSPTWVTKSRIMVSEAVVERKRTVFRWPDLALILILGILLSYNSFSFFTYEPQVNSLLYLFSSSWKLLV